MISFLEWFKLEEEIELLRDPEEWRDEQEKWIDTLPYPTGNWSRKELVKKILDRVDDFYPRALEIRPDLTIYKFWRSLIDRVQDLSPTRLPTLLGPIKKTARLTVDERDSLLRKVRSSQRNQSKLGAGEPVRRASWRDLNTRYNFSGTGGRLE